MISSIGHALIFFFGVFKHASTPCHEYTVQPLSVAPRGRSLDTNPLIQIKANVSAFQRLSGSLSEPFHIAFGYLGFTLCSGCAVLSLFSFFPIQCANVKPNRGYVFNTMCFISTGVAQSCVNVFCWSAGVNPGAGCDRVSR